MIPIDNVQRTVDHKIQQSFKQQRWVRRRTQDCIGRAESIVYRVSKPTISLMQRNDGTISQEIQEQVLVTQYNVSPRLMPNNVPKKRQLTFVTTLTERSFPLSRLFASSAALIRFSAAVRRSMVVVRCLPLRVVPSGAFSAPFSMSSTLAARRRDGNGGGDVVLGGGANGEAVASFSAKL